MTRDAVWLEAMGLAVGVLGAQGEVFALVTSAENPPAIGGIETAARMADAIVSEYERRFAKEEGAA